MPVAAAALPIVHHLLHLIVQHQHERRGDCTAVVGEDALEEAAGALVLEEQIGGERNAVACAAPEAKTLVLPSL